MTRPAATSAPVIPVAKPLLVPAKEIEPYLRRVDSSRHYSNFGPLAMEMNRRFGAHFGLAEGSVASASNATCAIAAALLSAGRPGRKYCLMPSWTFCATAHAARLAGLVPYFLDVDAGDWQLRPDCVAALPRALIEDAAAVVPVAPFGAALETAEWDAFSAATGLPVVVDAAASFDALIPGRSLSVVSLHATKSLGIGEGSIAISTDIEAIEAFRKRTCYGFSLDRSSLALGLNAKLSEYTAAVALAALDNWPSLRALWCDRIGQYFAGLREADLGPAVRADRASSTFVVDTRDAGAAASALRTAGIDTRRWWNLGCHREPAFRDFPAADLRTTEAIADRALGLPLYPDMTDEEVARVTAAIRPFVVAKSAKSA